MSSSHLQPALSFDALYAKSKDYIARALRCKGEKDHNEYQLWASLALELLGKACLAKRHPSLIVNPNHQPSLFAAARINVGTDIKTIISKTLFERLHVVVPGFDHGIQQYCINISERRNAELHSGELPFKNMELSAWEARYWRAAQLILHAMDLDLDNWLGANRAKAPQKLLKYASDATSAAAKVNIEQSRDAFLKKSNATREQLLNDAEQKQPLFYSGMFAFDADYEWKVECPACGGKAIFAGDLVDEVLQEEYGDSDMWEEEEAVEKHYVGESLFCPVCELKLDGQIELEAGGLETYYTEVETRKREYEPDYGNC